MPPAIAARLLTDQPFKPRLPAGLTAAKATLLLEIFLNL